MKFDTDIAPTVQQIVTITGVSERTARRWMRYGGPPYAVRLIELTLRGRIIPERWPHHWNFNARSHFETDSCHPALRWQDLTWYQYIISGWHEALNSIPRIIDSIDYLSNKLPRADVIELERYREKLEELRRSRPTDPQSAAIEAGHLSPAPTKETSRKVGC